MKHIITLPALVFATCCFGQVLDHVPSNGLVAWWPLYGNVEDAFGSLHGVSVGGVAVDGPTGLEDRAIALPGEEDFIDLPTGVVNEEQGLTLAFWTWLDNPEGGNAPLVDRPDISNNIWSLDYQQSNQLVHFITRNDDGTGYHNLADWAPPQAQWCHVATVYRAQTGTKELHVNGTLVSADNAPLEGFTMPTLRLGEVAEGIWNSNCRFSEVGLWQRDLGQDEILGLYQAGLPIEGCTNEDACNFNPDALVDNGTCVHQSLVEDISITACDSYEWEDMTLTESGVYSVSNLASIESVTYGGQFQDSHYFVTTDVMEWLEGADVAESLGGELCILNSEEELSFVVNTLAQHFTPGSQTNGVQEGAWVGLYNQQWIDGETGITLPCVHFDGDGPYGMLNLNDSTYQGGSDDPCFSDEQETWHNVVALIEVPVYALCEQLSELDLTILSCEDVQAFCGPGTLWDESTRLCVVANVSDTDFDGCVGINDFLIHLSNFGSGCGPESAWSCGDPLEYQGYDYETVQIGEQCWFAENLRAENYRNGDLLESTLGDAAWVNSTAGAIATYGAESGCSNNVPDFDACNPVLALAEFGLLYNGFSVDDERQICPTGWSVPTVSDWEDLEDYAGGYAQAGFKLKSSNGWADDGNGSNELFFGGKPGGYLWGLGTAVDNYQAGLGGYWWARGGDEDPSAFYLKHDSQSSFVSTFGPQHGFSVRCIKDSE